MRAALRRRGGPPDFVGVGTERTGTGWWLAALTAHPQIRGPRGDRPALHFFDAFCHREMQDADIAEYHAQFPHARNSIRGEWTDRYMSHGWVPPLLRRAAPDAKLLVMLADPIERYRAEFAECAVEYPQRGRMRTGDMVDRASYGSQVARLRRYYDEDRILILQYERCRDDVEGQYRRTLRFLGFDAEPSALRRMRPIPPAPAPQQTQPLWRDLEAALHTSLDPEVEALRSMALDLDVRLWPNFAHLAEAPTKRQPVGPAQTSSSVTAS